MDCLITKTPASVDDENLLKLDEFRVYIRANSSTSFKFRTSASVITEFRIVGEGTFTINGQKTLSLNCSSEQTIGISSGTYSLIIGKKYDAYRLTLPSKSSLDFDSIAYVNLSQLSMPQMVGDAKLEDINTSSMIDIDLPYPVGNLLKGDLSDIDNLSGIINLNLDSAGQITGDLSDFAGNSVFREINLARTGVLGSLEDFPATSSFSGFNFEGCAGITGSLSDYLDRVAAVKTSGTARILANDSGITQDVEASSYSPIVVRFSESGWMAD